MSQFRVGSAVPAAAAAVAALSVLRKGPDAAEQCIRCHVRPGTGLVRFGMMRSGSRERAQSGAQQCVSESDCCSPWGHGTLPLGSFFGGWLMCYVCAFFLFSRCGFVFFFLPLLSRGTHRAQQRQHDLGDLLRSFFRRYSLASRERVSPTTVLRIKGLTVRVRELRRELLLCVLLSALCRYFFVVMMPCC